MRLHIEIRPGEGGDDARLLVKEQAAIYIRHAERSGIKASIVQEQTAGLG